MKGSEIAKVTEKHIELSCVEEYSLFKEKNIYLIKVMDSYLKVKVEKKKNDVDVIYLRSHYENKEYQDMMMSYLVYVIIKRKMKNKWFTNISIEKG